MPDSLDICSHRPIDIEARIIAALSPLHRCCHLSIEVELATSLVGASAYVTTNHSS